MSITILQGDCRDVLKTLADCSVDSIVCDPPYELTSGKKGGTGAASVNLETPYGRARIGTGNGAGGFMGMKWDATGVAFDPAVWTECLRVLKPGGHLLAFSGTRTQHRMVCAIEDAGFEIRDGLLNVIAGDARIHNFMASLDDEQLRAFAHAIEDANGGSLAAWTFGSGFPKSLDVSKSIDKAAGAERDGLPADSVLRHEVDAGASVEVAVARVERAADQLYAIDRFRHDRCQIERAM